MGSNLTKIANFGTAGSGNSNLTNPYGFDADDRFLYIADQGNSRIIKWTLHGGSYVTQNSADVTNPRDCALIQGRLFVTDTGANRIVILDPRDLSLIKTFGSTGTGNTQFQVPLSITTDQEFFWIADSTNQRVVKYRVRDLAFVEANAVTGLVQQIVYDPSERVIYQIDASTPQVFKYRESDWLQVDLIEAADSTDGSLTGLQGVAIIDHHVYLLEASRIQVFDGATLTTRSTGGTSSNIADGNYIKGYEDHLILSDLTNERVAIWDCYKPSRSLTSGDSRTVFGDWFVNPVIPIGGKQEGSFATIGGSESSDEFVNIEEDPIKDNFAGVKES